jgi:Rrf2 family nitric oxide-sensitive transcriptional repressor
MQLAKDPENICIGKVVRDTEGGCIPVECFALDSGRCVIAGSCRLKGVVGEAVRAFYSVLDRYTLADITRNRVVLGKILSIRVHDHAG